jgi:solute carrier family 25 protein 14/30
LAVYDWIKKQLICRFHSSDKIGTHFVSSFTAGLAGALASTPIDVVRVS